MKAPPWLLVTSGALGADPGRTVVLDPSEAHHVTSVLRRRSGDAVVLIDAHGSVAEARLVSVAKGRVEAEVLSIHRETQPQLDQAVTVAVAVVGKQAMDWVVQKSVEIGVGRFVPIETARTQVHGRDSGGRMEHWRRISMQALKQCHRPWAIEIVELTPLPVFVESCVRAGIVADREGCAIDDVAVEPGASLVVGPEGGFTADECELFNRYGWSKVRFGPHVLRTETAAVVGAAMMVAREERR
jgi:16S rRNA (uracil1498-N3)-methyltransferase